MAWRMILYVAEFCRRNGKSCTWVICCSSVLSFSIHLTLYHTSEENNTEREGKLPLSLSLYKFDEIFISVFQLSVLYLSLDFHLNGNGDGSIRIQALLDSSLKKRRAAASPYICRMWHTVCQTSSYPFNRKGDSLQPWCMCLCMYAVYSISCNYNKLFN